MAEIVVGGRGPGRGDTPQVRAFGGQRAGVGILERDGLEAAQAKLGEHKLIEVRCGFRERGFAAAGEELKA